MEVENNVTPGSLDVLMYDFRLTVLPLAATICVEIVFGLFGNAFVLYGYTLRYPRSTYRTLILCLAVVDIVGCLTNMPAEVFTELYWFKFSFPTLCKTKEFFSVFILSLEILLLLIIAMDRYKQICMPSTVQLSTWFVMYLFLGSAVVSASLAIPAAVGYGHHGFPYQYKGHKVAVVICGLSEAYRFGNFSLIYSISLQTTACLSMGVMLLVYGVILKHICLRPRDIQLQSESTHLIYTNLGEYTTTKQRTVQMFLVSFLFVVTSLTHRITEFVVNTHVDRFSVKNTVTVLLFYQLYFINHVIHPVIYGILDPRFREIIKAMRPFNPSRSR